MRKHARASKSTEPSPYLLRLQTFGGDLVEVLARIGRVAVLHGARAEQRTDLLFRLEDDVRVALRLGGMVLLARPFDAAIIVIPTCTTFDTTTHSGRRSHTESARMP